MFNAKYKQTNLVNIVSRKSKINVIIEYDVILEK